MTCRNSKQRPLLEKLSEHLGGGSFYLMGLPNKEWCYAQRYFVVPPARS